MLWEQAVVVGVHSEGDEGPGKLSGHPLDFFPCNLRGMRGERAAAAVRTVASVFQNPLCVLWLLPSPGHPTAGAHFQIHADAWHRLEPSVLSAVSPLARPATLPMSRAMICDRLVRS